MSPGAERKLLPSILLASSSALVSLVVVFLAAEIATRIVRPAPPTPQDYPWIIDPSIGYEFKPHAVWRVHWPDISDPPEPLNSEGFRSEDLPLTKSPDEFRILALGDSTCFSMLVPREDSWAYLLEQMLNKPPRTKRAEVINAGVPGYVSYQALERLKRRGVKYNPDLVVVMVGWNDLELASYHEWKPRIDFAKLGLGALELGKDTIAHSRLLALLDTRLRKLRYYSFGLPTTRKDSGEPFNQQALDLFVGNLEGFRKICASHGDILAVAVQPTLFEVTPAPDDLNRKLRGLVPYFPLSVREWREWNGRYAEAIRQFAKAYPETVLIDPTEAFKASGSLFLDNVHLAPDGNKLLATEIARILSERGVLPAEHISSHGQPLPDAVQAPRARTGRK